MHLERPTAKHRARNYRSKSAALVSINSLLNNTFLLSEWSPELATRRSESPAGEEENGYI
jgi:hypothetical protein